jgi:hypothetical protein
MGARKSRDAVVPGARRMWWMLAALLAVGGGLVVFTRPWESSAQPTNSQRPRFAEDRDAGKPSAFDKERAFGYLKQICDLGPRVSATPEMARQQELLKNHFEKHGAKVELQAFSTRQRSQPRPITMTNLIARWHPERQRRIILCAHYDTRPIADQEPDPRNWRKPFLAANDGGAGPALLMELAHHMKNLELSLGVDFVLFDGEEYIFDNRAEELGGDVYFLGSDHFARQYEEAQRRRQGPKYVAAVLVDLFAGKNPRFPMEGHSAVQAGFLVEQVWGIAAELKATAFVDQLGSSVRDDHLALNRVGIPAIDIIDFDYPHWHRLSDVPANCSAESMEQVARVVTVWMQRMK